ncbi:aldehyde ferredoxin oxidoreductase family protein [Candidatus Bipolaricaulota bacterium]|nr:aldehyde ferredoxin oxidoreductase family protein [Candidatus Bipolaricaulota bacterium]
MKAWMGKNLTIDLSEKKVEVEQTRDDMSSRFLGGRGFGTKILFDALGPGVDPLSPGNMVVIAVGPLTGGPAPTPGRFSASTKSPLTGTITDSNCGGDWGPAFKRTGHDYAVLEGKSSEPTYLTIFDGEVELHDAKDLWGKKTSEVTETLQDRHGDKAKVLTIGPAGENEVRFATAMTGHSALGRGGLGAVLGSKNVKAVVVKGGEKIDYEDKDRLKFVNKEASRNINQSPITSRAYPQFGTAVLMNVINEAGMLPKNNYRNSEILDEVDEVSGEAISEKILDGQTGCWGCMIRCKRDTSLDDLSGEGPEYETDWALGPNCGNYDLKNITRANYLCNEYGLDTISAGSTIASSMEMSERGLVDWDLSFGDSKEVTNLVKKIATRSGIGDDLAEGSARLAEEYGHPELSMSVKGQELPAYDPRGAQGQGLCYATSNRGACHLRGGFLVGAEILGAPEMINRFGHTGKASLAVEEQDVGAVYDSLTICRFSHYAVPNPMVARLLSAAIGEEVDTEKLIRYGERIHNLERLFNLREGFGREDDTLPDRLLSEPLQSGPAEGKVVKLEPMLEEYYETRGWDEAGKPTEKKAKELVLEEEYEQV